LIASIASFPSAAFEVPSPSGSVQALMDCFDEQLFGAQTPNAPPEIAASFNGHGAQIAFRTCRDADRNIHYFIREHRPNPNGVCRTFEAEVFRGTATDVILVRRLYDGMADNWYFTIKGWTALPPAPWVAKRYPRRTQVLGFISGAECPPGGDARYIPLANVTDGTLKSFQHTWDRISATPEMLRAALEPIPVSRVTGIARFDTEERKRAFKERAISRALSAKQTLQSMICDEGGCAAYLDFATVEFDVGINGIAFKGLRAELRG
jgi:hypothetical protein